MKYLNFTHLMKLAVLQFGGHRYILKLTYDTRIAYEIKEAETKMKENEKSWMNA